MGGETVIKVDNVSKKFCRRLRHSMYYGTLDVARGMLGMESRTDVLRPGEFWAVQDVSFELKKGETLGVIGPNGSGKSTLLRLLNGIYQPDRGRIEVRGRIGALIAVGAGFHPLMTGRENIYLNGAIMGMSRKEIDRKFDAIVDFAGIGDFLDAPVKTYSSGMYVRLGFAVAIHCEPDILLVDEVLAVGDIKFQRKCFDRIGKLRNEGTSVILVTHGMHHLSAIASEAILLNEGSIEYSGDVNKAVLNYRKLLTDELESDIEKVVTSTERIIIKEVSFLPGTLLNPTEPFSIILEYEARESLPEVECDIVIKRENNLSFYFQATNRTVGKVLNIKKGHGKLIISLNCIPINGGSATLFVTLWERNRESILFWWRNINISFQSVTHSVGDNFLVPVFNIQD